MLQKRLVWHDSIYSYTHTHTHTKKMKNKSKNKLSSAKKVGMAQILKSTLYSDLVSTECVPNVFLMCS